MDRYNVRDGIRAHGRVQAQVATEVPSAAGEYALATGAAAVRRLLVLDGI
jgi:hypothetical protein